MLSKIENELYREYRYALAQSEKEPYYSEEEIKKIIKYYTRIDIAIKLFISSICMVIPFIIMLYAIPENQEERECLLYCGGCIFLIIMLGIFLVYSKYTLDCCSLYSWDEVYKRESISYRLFFQKDWGSRILLMLLIILLFVSFSSLLFYCHEVILTFFKSVIGGNEFITPIISVILLGIIIFIFVIMFYKRKILRISNKD